ncbi:hypothetical protein DY000_02046395 [Brassica cretica]|uniref:Uncharacterized protein n=1 Tax=Brassica cretica TaxID=69181 RepID=A0ABQ7EXU8_BRACR|nr:hypothetical protein DY000_02046395 [Brassica cretica]
MKTTQQSIDHNSQFLVDRGLDPKPDFCDPNHFPTFSSRPTSVLIFSWTEPSPGVRGLFIGISNQSETSRVAARVSLRMAPDACAAAPCAPLVFQHGLLTCKVAPCPLPVWMHGLAPCKETPRPPHIRPHASVACIATSRAWPFHLVLLCVTPHAVIIFTATPHDSLATYHSKQLPPRPDLIDRATSNFSVHSSNFGFSGEFFVPRSIPIFFDARSDDLNIFNKLQMNPDLTEKYFPSLRLPRKIHITEIRVSAQLRVFPSCFDPVLLGFRPASNL